MGEDKAHGAAPPPQLAQGPQPLPASIASGVCGCSDEPVLEKGTSGSIDSRARGASLGTMPRHRRTHDDNIVELGTVEHQPDALIC